MENLPQKYRPTVEKFIADKIALKQQGLMHEYNELVLEALSITKKFHLKQDDQTKLVQYIYQNVSVNETNGFDAKCDITKLIELLQELKNLKCNCRFL
jgi:hypothetical protein